MAPNVKLYYFGGSCSLVPHILLEEAGLPYDSELANVRDPEARAKYVATVNAKGQVPTLALDNEYITEGPAIQTAISQLAPEKHFFGKTPLDAARIYEWLNYCSGGVHSGSFSLLFRPEAWTTDASAAEGIKARGFEKVRAALGNIQSKVQGKEFAYGDGFTGVDAYLVLFSNWAEVFKISVADEFPELHKFVEHLKQRPAVKAALAKQIRS